MKRLHIFTATVVSVLVFSCVGLGQKRAAGQKGPPKPVPRKEIVEVDRDGRIEGRVYLNEYFGLKITLPESWIAQESAVGDAIKKKGAEMVKGKTAAVDKEFDKAVNRTLTLFTTSKDILGMADNAILAVSAEAPAPLVQFRNGTDYLRLSLQSMKSLQLPPDFKYSEEIKSESLGRETVPYIQIERQGYHQRIYVIQRKGYAVLFTLTYISDEDLGTMREMISTADLSWKG